MDENKSNEYLGTLKFMGQDENKNFYVQVEIVRSGPNRNGWDFQNMETLCKTFLGTPLLCAYLPNQIGDGHNFQEKTLPTGEQILDFTGPTAERIVGAISDDPNDIWTEGRDDGVWAIAKGKIWCFYNRQLVDRLALQGSMSVSAEIETYGGYTTEDGIEVYENWEGLGVTLLHESVPPAVPGANIQAIRAMSEEFKEMKFKAASYHGEEAEQEGEEQDFAAPEAEETVEDENPKKNGVKANMSLNRRETERLAPLFEGYRIVGLSEDSKQVILMAENGALYSYKFSDEVGNEVVASLIAPVKSVTVTCAAEADAEGTPADLDEIVKTLTAVNAENSETIKNLNATIETLNAKCEALEAVEHERRVDMVKASVKKALADIAVASDNAENCDNEAAELEANAEQYAEMETNGKFCGDTAAYDYLMSAYGKKVASARAQAKQTEFAWNRTNNNANGQADDGIAGLLARING